VADVRALGRGVRPCNVPPAIPHAPGLHACGVAGCQLLGTGPTGLPNMPPGPLRASSLQIDHARGGARADEAIVWLRSRKPTAACVPPLACASRARGSAASPPVLVGGDILTSLDQCCQAVTSFNSRTDTIPDRRLRDATSRWHRPILAGLWFSDGASECRASRVHRDRCGSGVPCCDAHSLNFAVAGVGSRPALVNAST
jgi:hypothetical protein